MHNSIAKQEKKTIYVSNNATTKPGKEGYEENKQRYENAKILTNEGKTSLDQNLAYQSMLPELVVSPANQGCAKSEGGSGCVVKRNGKWVILNNNEPGIWRDNKGKGFASAEAAKKVLSGYHANKG